MDFRSDLLVVGGGTGARHVVDDLVARDLSVQWAAMADDMPVDLPGVAAWPGSRLIQCIGRAGAYTVVLDHKGRRMRGQVAGIVLAGHQTCAPATEAYALQAGQKRIWTATGLAESLADQAPDQIFGGRCRVAFLNGWRHETHPVAAARMLTLCLQLQQSGTVDTFYLAGNLKVAVDGMEACSEAARAAGTVFLKFTHGSPLLTTLDDGRLRIQGTDEAGRMPFDLLADQVVVDERIGPDPQVARLAQMLGLEGDPSGFAQTDNVRRLTHSTNRRGIFVADAARAILTGAEQRADAAHLGLAVTRFLAGLDRGVLPEVVIDQGRCARCLTCYRLCPHGAVEITPHMNVVPEACQACGVCVAGCPNRAIRIGDAELDSALQAIWTRMDDVRAADSPAPGIVVFCCRRSAGAAREAALAMGHRLPSGVIVVEGLCGGAFSIQHLLSAFEAGADGVIVMTCHPGNCQSEHGTRHAGQRVREAAGALARTGLGGDRLEYHTLAANMPAEFVVRVNAFEHKLKALGPLEGQGA